MLSLRALLVTTLLLPFSLLAAQLNGISYNTLQNDEIELRFSLSENISKQPTVKTSMSPAQIKITFEADSYDPQLAKTMVEHAGVNHVTVEKLAGKVVATIHLNSLQCFCLTMELLHFHPIVHSAAKQCASFHVLHR